jgi:glucosamine-6-phosphate deaminase
MGMKTIMSAKQIIFMAFGESKQEITRQAFAGEITNDIPASFLQQHNNTTICVDFELGDMSVHGSRL